ncbi:predicted protein [Naegleria gruberi]|uniref:Predicted protein n=1 Tax=Naegleria gruberi TaxID=5762 RepID=D2W2B0_NAEGR|nr:uncharacterized protein NAEGRDRAFT_75525 [Naegleria gruberi]EFC36833.1 predicted protein [Naegleria gruberi]|eukprot:XP_002669577.1 predicted protein [Naegleria gruberi strain NEG-M]
MLVNEQYVKNTLKDINLIYDSHNQIIPEMEISFLDMDDILFRIKNCRGIVYTKDVGSEQKEWEFVLFTFCGYPLLVKVDKYGIYINDLQFFEMEKYSLSLTHHSRFNIIESIFNYKYEPVGYCGIDETFNHDSILEIILVEFFQQILTYLPTSVKNELKTDIDTLEYSFFQVPLMKDLISDIKQTYGRNSYKKLKIEKPKKIENMRKGRTRLSLSELLN